MANQPTSMRVVDRFVDHGAPLSFRELCARVLEEEHDYLILDLDKTTHLGRNLGELLEWELCAHEVYGDSVTGRPVWRTKVGASRDALPRLGQAGRAYPLAPAARLQSLRSRTDDGGATASTNGRPQPPRDRERGPSAQTRASGLDPQRP
ncbi:MAG: hypothetical protein JRE82_17635, partial [Deltaproteobacteria bacterium]|nr:hypothetical protein [Deltaproteobacteria bacterium]